MPHSLLIGKRLHADPLQAYPTVGVLPSKRHYSARRYQHRPHAWSRRLLAH